MCRLPPQSCQNPADKTIFSLQLQEIRGGVHEGRAERGPSQRQWDKAACRWQPRGFSGSVSWTRFIQGSRSPQHSTPAMVIWPIDSMSLSASLMVDFWQRHATVAYGSLIGTNEYSPS